MSGTALILLLLDSLAVPFETTNTKSVFKKIFTRRAKGIGKVLRRLGHLLGPILIRRGAFIVESPQVFLRAFICGDVRASRFLKDEVVLREVDVALKFYLELREAIAINVGLNHGHIIGCVEIRRDLSSP